MANLTEIRWHARGGQGAKTAATMLAEIVLNEGKYGQGFPDYGPERMGAPMRGFTRISDKPIRTHSAIYKPDIVIVLDPTLLDVVDVLEGTTDDAVVLINTHLSRDEMKKKLNTGGRKLGVLDATKISLDAIGRPIPNTPMLGALVKATNVIKLDTLRDDVRKKFAKKFPERVIQGNLDAIEKAYEEVDVS
ncbi:MAG: 2-oxoacid:acceptor oxidoreductase family protein [Acidobacteria bacterium]|nr:2-oxoacid:acceptor oxidoreductase family protein [Acidobacteriota bacterium]